MNFRFNKTHYVQVFICHFGNTFSVDSLSCRELQKSWIWEDQSSPRPEGLAFNSHNRIATLSEITLKHSYVSTAFVCILIVWAINPVNNDVVCVCVCEYSTVQSWTSVSAHTWHGNSFVPGVLNNPFWKSVEARQRVEGEAAGGHLEVNLRQPLLWKLWSQRGSDMKNVWSKAPPWRLSGGRNAALGVCASSASFFRGGTRRGEMTAWNGALPVSRNEEKQLMD